jgi:hypothetical protein
MPQKWRIFTGGLRASFFFGLLRAFIGTVAVSAIICPRPCSGTSPISGYNPARLGAEGNGVFITSTAFLADTALPVWSFLDDTWNGSFSATDRAVADTYWKAETGAIVNSWRVAGFNRGELFIDTNRDTVEFFYRNKKHLDLPTGKQYDINLAASGFAAYGVEISYGRKLDALITGLAAGVTLRYLNPQTLQDGAVTGIVTPNGPKSYDFDLKLDYAYGRNILYKRKDEHLGHGYGYSADAGLLFQSPHLRLEALVRDIAGTIVWNSVPYTNAVAGSDTITTSPDGYQEFRPTIHGFEGHKEYRQRIPIKTDLIAKYGYGPVAATCTVNFIETRPLYWLEAEYRFSDSAALSIGYNVNYSAVIAGANIAGFELDVVTDEVTFSAAKALGLRLSYKYSW